MNQALKHGGIVMLSLEQMTPWVMMNFSLTMALLAVPMFLLHMLVNAFTKKRNNYEIIYIWVTFLAVGVVGIYTFVMHVFFPVTSAAIIGWHTSPFQFEVGMADLGFGLVALLAARASYGFRLASVIGVTCWLWGDAVGHVYQMLLKGNYSIGNAGSWFWLDLLIPAILIICIANIRLKVILQPPIAAQYQDPTI